jgi:hypothetical protein
MGRRKIHHTPEEQAAARRKWNSTYNHSAQYAQTPYSALQLLMN